MYIYLQSLLLLQQQFHIDSLSMAKQTNLYIFILLIALIGVTLTQQCMSNCAGCTEASSCSSCNDGYFLDPNNVCVQCPVGCTQCSFNTDTKRIMCTACEADLKNYDGQCFKCSPLCGDLQCTQKPDQCNNCKDGYTLNSNGGCIYDGTNADKNFLCLQQNNGECTQCRDGYFLMIGECLKCFYPSNQCQFPTDSSYDNIKINLENFLTQLSQTFSNFTETLSDSLTTKQKQEYIFTYHLISNLATSDPEHLKIYSYLESNSDKLSSPILQIIKAVIKDDTNSETTIYEETFTSFLKQSALHTNCFYGFGVSSDKCSKCSKSNCLQCAEDSCSKCEIGYYLDSETNVCNLCSQSINYCSECSTASDDTVQCSSCLAPFSLHQNKCSRCIQPCATCSQSECFSCIKPFSIYPNANKQCFRCGQDSCHQCSQTNPQICLECRESFYLNGGICSRCASGCSTCSDQSVCSSCLPGYMLAPLTDTCVMKKCPKGCKTCTEYDTKICLSCQQGYFLDNYNHCQYCDSNGCSNYNENGVCQSLDTGKTVFKDKIVKCRKGCKYCDSSNPEVCLECMPGFWLDQQNSICGQCGDFCKKCADKSTCEACVIFAINNNDGSCSVCTDNCLQCQGDQCLACRKGYNLVAGSCVHQCQQNCLACDADNSTQCIECAPGYSLFDGSCMKCTNDCTGLCDASNITVCLTQSFGFDKHEKKKAKCPKNCLQCENGRCLSCNSGYEDHEQHHESYRRLLTDSNKASKIIPNHNKNQQNSQSKDETQDQNSNNEQNDDNHYNKINDDDYMDYYDGQSMCGWYVDRPQYENNCKKQCSYPCISCDDSICEKCDTGYALNASSLCQLNTNLSEEFCPVSTYKSQDNTSCLNCPSNCVSCVDSSNCYVCNLGYYESNKQCLSCDANCTICTSQKVCQACQAGYYLANIVGLEKDYNLISGQCLSCSSQCQNCFGSPDFCISCKENFTLNGLACKSPYYLSFIFKYDIQYDKFLKEGGSGKVIKAIRKALGVKDGSIFINSIVSGSTIVEGDVTFDNQTSVNENKNLFNNIEHPYTALEATVSDHNAAQNQTNSNDHDANQESDNNQHHDSKQKLGIIIGCAVGGALLIVLIILIICCCIKKRKNPGTATPDKETPVTVDGYTPGSVHSTEGIEMH